MQANEFVKEHGWESVIDIVKNAPDWACETAGVNDYADEEWAKKYPMSAYVKISELKRLVTSYDLVQSFGGLNNAKRFIDDMHEDALIDVDESQALYGAIADVESCQ